MFDCVEVTGCCGGRRTGMCGITGLWNAGSVDEDTSRGWLERMADTLVHRGPDGAGVFFDREAGLGFAHRRLSILDLSERGQQPMRSHSGRTTITYNGEVYNAPEIRAALDRDGWRAAWRGHSDTEVVLEAIEAWGLEAALERFDGMFAFAVWDRERDELHLARDRFGVKPLYYSETPDGFFVFASEAKAILGQVPATRQFDEQGLAEYLSCGCPLQNRTLFQGIELLPAGSGVHTR